MTRRYLADVISVLIIPLAGLVLLLGALANERQYL